MDGYRSQMSLHAMGEDEFDGIRASLAELTGEALDEAPPLEGPADLERLALNLIGPFAAPDMPPAAAELLPRALLDRGDALAAGILTCLERFAPGPLSTSAAKARSRLARKGIVSPLGGELGALVAEECYAISLTDGHGEILAALLRRPEGDEFQGALLVVEHVPCGGVIVKGLLSDPDEGETLRAELLQTHDRLSSEPIARDEFARRLLRALGHMVDHEVPLRVDVVAPLLVLERALGGGIGRWPQPLLEFPDDDEDEEEAEATAAREHAEELIEAFALSIAAAADSRPALDHAPFVAQTLCSWKLEVADDCQVERWTTHELERFLLIWYPYKGDSQGETVEALPDCVEAFLRFLADSGRLAGDAIGVLVATLTGLRKPFREAALDPSRWGTAKTIVMQMRADGVDPGQPGAAEQWLQEFNARPDGERERVMGRAFDLARSAALITGAEPASDRGAPPARDTASGRRKARRRAAKASRRRNRR